MALVNGVPGEGVANTRSLFNTGVVAAYCVTNRSRTWGQQCTTQGAYVLVGNTWNKQIIRIRIHR